MSDKILKLSQAQTLYQDLRERIDALPTDSDIPEVPVQDVQVNGTSILSQGVANVPIANDSRYGVVKTSAYTGIIVSGETLVVDPSNSAGIKAGNGAYKPIVTSKQHESTFYGLAKAAGADEKDSTLPLGTYTDTAKTAIRSMLGAASPNVIAVQDTQPTNSETKVWLPETQATGVQVPTMDDLADYVQKTDYATATNYGLVKVYSECGITINDALKVLQINYATPNQCKMRTGSTAYQPLTVYTEHTAAFYGLAYAAGDTTQTSSANTVGTYTDSAKDAIQRMLGVDGLIASHDTATATAAHAINEVFIMGGKLYKATAAIAVGDTIAAGTNCEAKKIDEVFVKNTDYAGSSSAGVVKVGSAGGLYVNPNSGVLQIQGAQTSVVKTGTDNFFPITSANSNAATFYGLAKAAGDTTQSSSANAVGTYTSEAKAAIQSMLGIDLATIATQVEIPLVETVTGTTPSITGQPNTRYVCGEVSTISITPPSAGSVDVIFESGSTAAVLTVPNTVKWPAWFDATSLKTDTTYEILITDGVYGSVMTWAT